MAYYPNAGDGPTAIFRQWTNIRNLKMLACRRRPDTVILAVDFYWHKHIGPMTKSWWFSGDGSPLVALYWSLAHVLSADIYWDSYLGPMTACRYRLAIDTPPTGQLRKCCIGPLSEFLYWTYCCWMLLSWNIIRLSFYMEFGYTLKFIFKIFRTHWTNKMQSYKSLNFVHMYGLNMQPQFWSIPK